MDCVNATFFYLTQGNDIKTHPSAILFSSSRNFSHTHITNNVVKKVREKKF